MKILGKRSKIVIGIFVLILVIFSLNVFQKEVRGFFYFISSPIQKVLWKAGESSSDFLTGVIKRKDLKEEIDELNLKNQGLLQQVADLKELERENKVLREALALELQKEFNLSLAQVIGKDISQDFILIDKGLENGISKNMPVITEQKVLVGKISDVYKNFSKVILISNKEISFDAKILPPKELSSPGELSSFGSGVVRGQGNSKILFDLVPREEDLFPGDILTTSALGGTFPKGLLVGRIKEIKKSDLEPFQQAEIEPFFDISQVEKIFIILDF